MRCISASNEVLLNDEVDDSAVMSHTNLSTITQSDIARFVRVDFFDNHISRGGQGGFPLPMDHYNNYCTCYRERSWGCNRMLIGSMRSVDQMSSPAIVLGSTLTAPLTDVETFMMGSSTN